MKVLIEDVERSLFLTETGKWTPFEELARNFRTTIDAWDHWDQGKEAQKRVYISFHDPRFNVRLDPGKHYTSGGRESLAERL